MRGDDRGDREGMRGEGRGDRDGMRREGRGDRDGMRGGRRGGADVNIRIRGDRGDRGYAYGRRFHRGMRIGVGRCRMVVKRIFFRHHMVVKRIRRCF
jgi:hypothetical protein